ncbi:hypothetical protein Q3G72_000006 [Acer saccharum]|nr:hypothetical protein Q3G72_000006 [Acer saccharum]
MDSDPVMGLGVDGLVVVVPPLLWLPLLLLLLVPLRVRDGELRSAIVAASWREMIRDQGLGREKRKDGGGMVDQCPNTVFGASKWDGSYNLNSKIVLQQRDKIITPHGFSSLGTKFVSLSSLTTLNVIAHRSGGG